MKIYEFRDFPNPRRVRVFLAEKGLSDTVTFEQVDVLAGAHRTPEFLKLNPSGQVPALQLEDGAMINGCVAISRYFEAAHPETPLMGGSAQEQAAVSMWQRIAEEGLMDASTTYFHHATDGLGDAGRYRNKDWGDHALERVRATLSRLDGQLAGHPFIAGAAYSIADVTALCGVDFSLYCKVIDLDDYPNVKRWHADVSARPSAAA